MSKVLAFMMAGLFATAAFAQKTQPEEINPQAQGKTAERAEAKKAARPAGQVKAPAGDQSKVAEGSGGVTATASDKAAEARRDTRDTRRPAKDGGKKPVPKQGGTPE